MAINPIAYTEHVTRSFLRYQLTTYAFADPGLREQMRSLLSLDETRNSPLLRGPFISLSRSFRQGSSIDTLINEGIFHPHMRERIPSAITHLYGHQDLAVRAIHAKKNTLVSTGTGSGKTESFLYPIISQCLKLRDAKEPSGISAVIVYPMNALAEDQLGRLRGLLAGTGIRFGMYVGKTPNTEAEVSGIRLPPGSSRADYERALEGARIKGLGETVYPAEEVCSRELMRNPGHQPRILLTNVKQLELLLTRQQDIELFNQARLDFLVFDEAHTFTGANGAETSVLIRRLRNYCGRPAKDSVCIATSATIVDRSDPDAAINFASRFFGVNTDSVVTVQEDYQADSWAAVRTIPPPPADPVRALDACVKAVDSPDAETAVREAYRLLCGNTLPVTPPWQEALFESLSANEFLYRLSECLSTPMALGKLPDTLGGYLGRLVSEEEILAWLTLGAAARGEERPLVRPVVHVFVKGISGAVVSFPKDVNGPKLWLSTEEGMEQEEQQAYFPVSACTVCGQHYFESHLEDFSFTDAEPGGGHAEGHRRFWKPLGVNLGGKRALLVDTLIESPDEEDLDDIPRLRQLHVCRYCGTAHPDSGPHCLGCGQSEWAVKLYVIRQTTTRVGKLSSCISCANIGHVVHGVFREPARKVKASQVADVHVLAQDMLQRAERKRLLVFSDNRQDAAFQAGWMRDHARRFRLRSLMAEEMQVRAISIGDLAESLCDRLDRDDALSRMLIPEVWKVRPKEGPGGRHEQERRKFLRMQVLREITMSGLQVMGLEPWGRMKVEYAGLEPSLPWIRENANRLGMPAEDLCLGVATVLDYFRRKRILFDSQYQTFNRTWFAGDQEISQGYLPPLGNPLGTKFRRQAGERGEFVTPWLGAAGDTTLKQIARKWGVPDVELEDFLSSLYSFLTDRELGFLKDVLLISRNGIPLPGVTGLYQVNADLIRLHAGNGIYRCRSCNRRIPRKTPGLKCPAWRCNGILEFRAEDRDDYNLQLLDQQYDIIRPEEHTAMIPQEDRERLENLFKGDSESVNALVCTPTLELGVDIGQLDTVLMRNVPPLPANYWQRVGRAGRRHRMAVDVTYCKATSHDRAYFAEPIRILQGKVDPPAFNLRNEVMVAKHVHATVITRLHQLTRESSLPDAERNRIALILQQCLPTRIKTYVFNENEELRLQPFPLVDLEALIRQHLLELTNYVKSAFHQVWPVSDERVVREEELTRHIESMTNELSGVIKRIEKRVKWAMNNIRRINEIENRTGTVDPEDEAIRKRCRSYIDRIKGNINRQRYDNEGLDESNTFSVLSVEGFLPGYGLEVGSVIGYADAPNRWGSYTKLNLPRPNSMAIREYVPGNLIYTNGNRFIARRYRIDNDADNEQKPLFQYSPSNQAIAEVPITTPGSVIPALRICDTDLIHQSHISDDEEVRFQLASAVLGIERNQHNGGRAYLWNDMALQHRYGVRFRLVNIGVQSLLKQSEPKTGFPICTRCGQSISPLSSAAAIQKFEENHQQRCGQRVLWSGLYTDVVADAITLMQVENHTIAFSVLEAIRMGAAMILDMHVEDLQILVIGDVTRSEVNAMLWDPMAGGSGLLDTIIERFKEIHAAALRIVEDCPSECDSSCIDCMQTYRNSFYHANLNRHEAAKALREWGDVLEVSHSIPNRMPEAQNEGNPLPANDAEEKLRRLLSYAGFPEGVRGRQIRLDPAIGTTTPDIVYQLPDEGVDEGIAIYLDGMNAHIHGNPETAEKDRLIREWLRNNGWDVITITVTELDDRRAMSQKFRRLARLLGFENIRNRMQADDTWYDGGQ